MVAIGRHKLSSLQDLARAIEYEPTFQTSVINTIDKPRPRQHQAPDGGLRIFGGSRQRPLIPEQYRTTAVEGLRRRIERKYKHRAPQASQKMLDALEAFQNKDPVAAKSIPRIDMAYGAGSGVNSVTRQVVLGASDRGTLLHELGHVTDMAHNPSILDNYSSGLTHKQMAQSAWPAEASATQHAFELAGSRDVPLMAANGSYFEAGVDGPVTVAKPAPRVTEAIDRRMARQAGHEAALDRLGVRTERMTTDQFRLYRRLQEAAENRRRRLDSAKRAVTNPVLAPHLQAESKPYVPSDNAVAALDHHYGAGAGEAAYKYEEALRQHHLENKSPIVPRAEQLLELGDAVPAAGPRAPATPAPVPEPLPLPEKGYGETGKFQVNPWLRPGWRRNALITGGLLGAAGVGYGAYRMFQNHKRRGVDEPGGGKAGKRLEKKKQK